MGALWISQHSREQTRAAYLRYPVIAVRLTIPRTCVTRVSGVNNGEANLSSEKQAPHSDAWVSNANGNEMGERGTKPTAQERPQASHR